MKTKSILIICLINFLVSVLDTFSVLDLTDRTVINADNAKSLIVDRTWLSGL